MSTPSHMYVFFQPDATTNGHFAEWLDQAISLKSPIRSKLAARRRGGAAAARRRWRGVQHDGNGQDGVVTLRGAYIKE